MKLFHDEEDGNPEPIAGLPENLPEGEHIRWQGKPNALTLAVHAFHIRFVAIYFALFTLWRLASIASREGAASDMMSVIISSSLGAIIGIGLLTGIAWLMAHSTIYTITNKRVILRYGVAIRKYVNIPFTIITAANLKHHAGDAGSIALATSGDVRIAYLHLWPYARPLRYSKPEPMLRALPQVTTATQVLCAAMKEQSPSTVSVTPTRNASGQTRPLAGEDAVATA